MNESELIPFGKFKGQPVSQLEHDPQYAQWILATPGLRDKFPRFYSIVVNNFGEPADSPEHNSLQAMFLDEEFAMSVIAKIGGWNIPEKIQQKQKTYFNQMTRWNDDRLSTTPVISLEFISLSCDVEFEVNGWDVKITPIDVILVDGKHERWGRGPVNADLPKFIELKPSIGEDFPAVLRQVKSRREIQSAVITREFCAESVSLENVVKMFATSKIQFLLLSDIPIIPLAEFGGCGDA